MKHYLSLHTFTGGLFIISSLRLNNLHPLAFSDFIDRGSSRIVVVIVAHQPFSEYHTLAVS